jgi:hypothetical protein
LRILIACEFSGIVRDAFIARGHDAISCDLLPTEKPGPHYQGDVFDIINDGFDLMIAHPPCTYLTVTGNKWFKPEFKDRFPDRDNQRTEAIAFFMALANAPIDKICIENPVGIMSRICRRPDQIIQPYQFGHVEPKKTCLWLKNLPCLIPGLPLFCPEKIMVPEYHRTKSGNNLPKWYAYADKSKGQAERAKIRSRTFQGIADAMAETWGTYNNN